MSDNGQVGQFHHKFGLDSTTFQGAGPREVPKDLMEFRIKFLEEELQEFKDAYAEGDEAKMFDALIDLVYVAHGTAHIKGYPWIEGWAAVQHANMQKVRNRVAADSERGGTWDIIKPAGWTAPNIEGILEAHGWPKK